MTNRSELRQQAQRARSGLAHLSDEANRMQNRIDELEAEVERLREEVAMYRSALANSLRILQPLPATPTKEE